LRFLFFSAAAAAAAMSRSRPSPLAGSTEGASAALLHDSVDPTFTSPRGRGSIDRDAGGQAYVRANAASLQAGSDAYAYAALNAIPDQRFVQSQILTPPHTVNNYSRYAYDPSTANGTPIDKQLLSPHESLNDIAFLSPIATTQSPMAVAAHPAERSNIDAQGRPVLKTPSKHPRLLSLDAFRGLTISWMIMADEFGSIWSSKLDHSPWNEIRFADFVFPAFVFIVGLAVPMSLRNASSTMQSRLAATKRVTWRSVKMFFIGFYVDGGTK
jgi:hypothetical protein